MSTEATKVSNVLDPATQHNNKKNKQNRKNRSKEGNNETKKAATEDNTKEDRLTKAGIEKDAAITVLPDSVLDNDALTDSTSTDHTEDLVSDPNEAPTTSVTKAKMNIEKWTMLRTMLQRHQM